MTGYFRNDLFEPLSLKSRHDILAEEINKRGYNHSSELIVEESDFSYLTIQEINHKIDKENSLKLLLMRCNKCYSNYLNPQTGVSMYSVTMKEEEEKK